MRPITVPVVLATMLPLALSANAKDASKQQQIESNTARIEVLEARTTLDDLGCAVDEVAAFDGSQWTCTTPAELISIYEVRRPITLTSHPTLPQTVRWDAFCSFGDLAIGGGYQTPFGSFSYRVVSSHRHPTDERAWSTDITVAAGTITLDGAAYAYCLDRTP